MKTFFSPGKLLLTSEYLVLDGAIALAVPTKLGQEFFYEEINDHKSEIFWEAYHENKLWLKAKFNYKNWEILETNLPDNALFILKILQNVQKLSLNKFKEDTTYHFRTNLQFPANFGLGSSSTLMNNLSQWAKIDAFQLNEISLGGSGYDIAVAKENSAILYQKNNTERWVEKIKFNPIFKNELIFVHLNQKQDSREGIKLYQSKAKNNNLVEEFSDITRQIQKTENLSVFSNLMEMHEQKLSQFLETQTVKEKYFKDCPVFVKSLGAWGGDFVLTSKFGDYKNYFSERKLNSIFDYESLIN